MPKVPGTMRMGAILSGALVACFDAAFADHEGRLGWQETLLERRIRHLRQEWLVRLGWMRPRHLELGWRSG
jgi:hypothetical protein